MLARMYAFAGNIKSHISYEIKHFFQLWGKAGIYAEQRMWWDYYCRLISPDSIEENKDYLEMTDYRIENIVVGLPADGIDGWPPETANEFMEELMNTSLKGCTILVSLKITPIPNSEAHNMLRSASYSNQSNQKTAMDANDLHLPDEELKLDLRDINAGIQQLHDNKEKMVNGSFIITIWAEDETAMKQAKSHVKGVLNAYRVSGRYPHYREFDAFIASQPYPEVLDMATIPLFTSFAAKISPTINPNTLIGTDEEGVYLCDDRQTGREFIVNFKELPAPHILLVGATGSGKTYALLLLLMRLYVDAKRKVIYLTVKPDPKTKYRAVAEYFGKDGAVIDLGPGKYNINPLQLIFDKNILQASSIEVAAKYDAHKDIFCTFLKEWFQDTYSVNMDSYVDETLDRLYIKKGIIRDDARTWVEANWPVMCELRELWEQELPELAFKKHQTCESLIEKTSKIRRGGAFDHFNRPTNIKWDLGFIIIDLAGIPESIRDPMNVLLTGMLANQVTSNAEKGLTIAIDEGGAFLREKRPAKMILTGLTQWRAQDCQMIFCTQQFSDMKKADLAEEFLTNCHTKIVLGAKIDQSAVPYIEKTLFLNEDAIRDLVTSKRGEGIIKISNIHAAIAFDSTEEEHKIIKGWYTEDPAKDEAEQITVPKPVIPYEIHEMYKGLCDKNKIIFEFMMKSGYSAKALEDEGYKFYQPQRAVENGILNCWIHESILKAKHDQKEVETLEEEQDERKKKYALNQTIDHYSTVIQIAAYLMQLGFKDVQVHHEGDVDVSGELNGKTFAFEYERNKNQSIDNIRDKNSRAKLLYDYVFFACPQNMNRKVKTAVGKYNFAQRGFGLKDLIDSLVDGSWFENDITEYQPTDLLEPAISPIEAE